MLTTNGRNIEDTAVGFNKKKKGARSYYPLFCTIAQTGQVFMDIAFTVSVPFERFTELKGMIEARQR